MKSIVAVVHDPGACAMLLPVLKELSAATVYASVIVAPKLKEAGISFQDISKVQIKGATVILTGTSWGSHVEQIARNEARRLKIKSVVVIDYWANYLERFEGIDHSIKDITDEICVVDEVMKDEMIAAGFPPERISIVGHPYLESLARQSKKSFIGKLNIKDVLILSEPVRFPELTGKWQEASGVMLDIISKIKEETQSPCRVHFKFHPKESHELPTEWKGAQVVGADLHLPDGYKKFDLVMGYQSMGLLEAALLGQMVISVPTIRRDGVRKAFENAGVVVTSSPQGVIEKLQMGISQTQPVQFQGSTKAILKKII